MAGAKRPLELCLGGTFDPVHNAHLRILWEACHRVRPDRVRLLPAHIPPHKGEPQASPAQRLDMLQLAVRDQPDWLIDPRELQRQEPSYTRDTLADLRREFGPDTALVWLLGMDSFASLDTWHRWQELSEYAHLLVVARPGAALPSDGPIASWAQNRRVDVKGLRNSAAGNWAQITSTLQDISSSGLRAGMAEGLAPRYLVPDTVCDYILEHRLYHE